ncbi:hypothetical protein GCK32_011806 [Trichostrongylus colubriformis]|uniref:Uncharacterized protein n=1 Tax=Trichostrongylus colubriformis TaxID=6319 RepID=A0AAN8I898_TRICO
MDEIFHDRAAQRREVRLQFIDDAVDYFQQQIGYTASNESQWNLMSAMYYAGTLFTTIDSSLSADDQLMIIATG